MKRSLLADIFCPACVGTLNLKVLEQLGDQIVDGELRCVRCERCYPIRKGIPNLMPPSDFTPLKSNEMQGWVSLWKKQGMYSHPTFEDSFKLPFLDGGVWPEVARMFELALREMNLKGDEVILDVGAGQGWAARYFAEKGCRVIAIDLVDDEWYGLGRSWAIMEYAGVYFEPVLADGEDLPFFDNRFDIVFFCGALHHFHKFDRILRQVYRVLKPGGRLIASGEPSVSIFAKEQDALALLEEVNVGITERRPKVYEYWMSLKRAGFGDVSINTFETYNAPALQVYNWIALVRQNMYRTVKRGYKLFVWLAFSVLLMLPHRWTKRIALFLNGGNLLLRAIKSAHRKSVC